MILKDVGDPEYRESETPGAAIALNIIGVLAIILGVILILIGLDSSSPESAFHIGEGLSAILGAILMLALSAAVKRLHSIDENLAGIVKHVILPQQQTTSEREVKR